MKTTRTRNLLAGTRARGWMVVDMKRDWKVVFPFELSR